MIEKWTGGMILVRVQKEKRTGEKALVLENTCPYAQDVSSRKDMKGPYIEATDRNEELTGNWRKYSPWCRGAYNLELCFSIFRKLELGKQ